MARKKSKLPNKLLPWVEAAQRYHLSNVQIQMARELGMTPKSLAKITPSKHQPWKLPRGAYIEELYRKRFHKASPENVPQFREETPKVEPRPKPFADEPGRIEP